MLIQQMHNCDFKLLSQFSMEGKSHSLALDIFLEALILSLHTHANHRAVQACQQCVNWLWWTMAKQG